LWRSGIEGKATNGRGPVNAYIESCPNCRQPIHKCYPIHREIIHIPDIHSASGKNCPILVTIKGQAEIDRRPCHRCQGEGCERCDHLGEVGKATALSIPRGVGLEQARKHFRVGLYRRSDEV
jgi:hypothetical protein